jgi:uncharacterized protein YgbK (DUF1537 family)
MLKLAVVADDITGAADSGIQFADAYSPVYLLDHRRLAEQISLSEDPPQVLSVFTSTRDAGPDDARRTLLEIGDTLAARKPERVFKKIDSCLRGNIGCELEALMESLSKDLSFIAPAFPAQGRTTRAGVHRLHGVPVAQTEIGCDPLTPVKDSRLDAWIGRQMQYACFHVGLAVLDAGEQALSAEVERRIAAGVRHLTFDAEEDVHLERIAAFALARYPRALLCGSAGLARALAAAMAGRRPRVAACGRPRVHRGTGHFLFVCGSASATLHRQVDKLIRAAPVAIEELPCENLLARERATEYTAAVQRAADALGRSSVVIKIAPPERTRALADPRALTPALGRFAAALIAVCRPAGVFLSGGDTAAAVLAAINTRAIKLENELPDGVVWGTIQGGTMAGRPTATKAGAFGQPEALQRFHAALNGEPEGC